MLRVGLLALGTAIAIERVAGAAPCEIAAPADVAVAVDGTTATLTFVKLGVARVVRAVSCAELVDAVALIVAMADEPHAPAAPPVDVHVALENAVSASAEHVAPPSTFDLVAGGGGAHTSHGWQQQVTLGARWRREGYSLGVELAVAMPESAAVGTTSSVSIRTAAATASPCIHAGPLAACALATIGIVDGSGVQLDDARNAVTPLVALGARLAWEQGISDRLALRLHVDLEGNLTRSQFDVDHMVVWVSDRFSAWVGIDVLVHFP